MKWLDEIEQKLKVAKPLPPFIKQDDKVDLVQLHANAVFANDSLAIVAKLIAAVRMAYGELAYIANHDIDVTVFDGAVESARNMQSKADEALAKLQSGEFGNKP